MKMFGHPKRQFFTSKAKLNFEVYGQWDKITPEAGEKGPFFDIFFSIGHYLKKTVSKG